MKPSEIYFVRTCGEWNWTAEVHIKNWSGFLLSELAVLHKFRIAAFVLSQYFIGKYRMWTSVNFDRKSAKVFHSTRIYKWGINFLRSEKIFTLDPDGVSLLLSGHEYYWPFTKVAVPFTPMNGAVEVSATRAHYQMPLLGMPCDCRAILEPLNGEIALELSWFLGRFSLTEKSMEILRSRFGNSHTDSIKD